MTKFTEEKLVDESLWLSQTQIYKVFGREKPTTKDSKR